MIRLHQLQTGDINIKVHFLFNSLVARTQSFDFRIGQGGFVNIVAGTDGRFARHNLTDEFLLVFKGLPKVRIKGRFGDIAVNVDFGIHITLANDTTAALLKVAGSPRGVKVMQSDKSVLDIHAGSHLKGRTHKHTDLPGTNFAEQFLFSSFGVCFMDESNLFSRNTSCDKFLTDVVIYGEVGFFGGAVFFRKMLQGSKLRAV